MDIAKFWKMIEVAREASNSSIEKQLELLVEALAKESDEDTMRFDQILEDMIDKAYRVNLKDACDFINCGCSDEDFADFRAWLVAQGEDVFTRAIENPDSLVDVVDVDDSRFVTCERFAYVGSYAYERKNNDEIPRLPREREPQFMGNMYEKAEEELVKLFPALMAKLGSCSEWRDKYRDMGSDSQNR